MQDKITLISVSGQEKFLESTIKAAEYSNRKHRFKTKIVSNVSFSHEYIEYVPTESLDYQGYSDFCIQKMVDYIDTDFMLIFQNDGFILDSNLWLDEFFDYDYIVIDCPPAFDDPFTESVLLISDLALVPIVPSLIDVNATLSIQKIILYFAGRRKDDSFRALLLLNMCQMNLLLTKSLIEVIDTKFSISRTDVCLAQRQAYRYSVAIGGSVFDLKDDKAKDEILALRAEVLEAIE